MLSKSIFKKSIQRALILSAATSSLVTMNAMSLEPQSLITSLTVEEKRIALAQEKMPEVLAVFSSEVTHFSAKWKKTTSFQSAQDLIKRYGNQLWLLAKEKINSSNNADDRSLYWTRLLSSRVMRTVSPQFAITPPQLDSLLSMLEQGSRGRTDLEFSKGAMKKIILTGFDPFLLNRNINQSNPSGVAALMLDGKVIKYYGITAEINTVMIPVRYEDFDQGTIEALLAPYYALNNVDMVVTVSMGRKEFDLERFPGKRRSVTAPDNLDIVFGGTQVAPKIPYLQGKLLSGSEFVEFSLPVAQMQLASGPYKVIDNHQITTLEKTYKPEKLSELDNKVAVNGAGGGYLSNEISYRSIRIRNIIGSSIPTGHIHTPRIKQFEPEIESKIVEQIRAMLEKSLPAL